MGRVASMGQDIKEVWKVERNGENESQLHHKLLLLRLKSLQVGLQLRRLRWWSLQQFLQFQLKNTGGGCAPTLSGLHQWCDGSAVTSTPACHSACFYHLTSYTPPPHHQPVDEFMCWSLRNSALSVSTCLMLFTQVHTSLSAFVFALS